MTTLRIPVHSFVDIITNSSSEIFISATSSTVEVINKLIDSLLLAGGSRFKSADIFDITLEGSRTQTIVIKTKINSPAAQDAAKILSDLTSTFDIRETYNG